MRTILLFILLLITNACQAQQFRAVRIFGIGQPIKIKRAGTITVSKEYITINYTAGGNYKYRILDRTPPYLLSCDQRNADREIWILRSDHILARRIYLKSGRIMYIDYYR